MGYWKLLKLNPRTIGFGFLVTFFSGLGQTHFISLFNPIITQRFDLTATEYGSLYSLITLLSGFAITFIGPLIDTVELRKFTLVIAFGLMSSLALIYPLHSLLTLGLGLFGLRLFGQGLCSSLSSIAIARYFTENRGRALSLSQMGFPVYEGLITPLGAALITSMSFQSFLVIFGLSLLMVFAPIAFFLTRQIPEFNQVAPLPDGASTIKSPAPPTNGSNWSRRQVFTDKQVYFLIPQTLMPPFALTGIFFHMALIAELKNWSLELAASGLFFFATGRIVNSFITGPLVDRLSAIKLFPYYQLPLTLGFLILGLGAPTWVPALCFLLFGLSVGSGGPIKSAIWAELYGVLHLGAIKSLFASLMVLSTAASPVLFGWILDRTHSPQPLLVGLCVASLACSALSFWGLRMRQSSLA